MVWRPKRQKSILEPSRSSKTNECKITTGNCWGSAAGWNVVERSHETGHSRNIGNDPRREILAGRADECGSGCGAATPRDAVLDQASRLRWDPPAGACSTQHPKVIHAAPR